MTSRQMDLPAPGQWTAVTPAGRSAIASIAADPAGVLLASDFDGTLAPIVDDPRDSRLHPRSRAALDALGSRLGQMAIVTGRGVDVVRGLGHFAEPGFSRLLVLGQYGQERWDEATQKLDVPPSPIAVRAAMADLKALLDDEAEPFRGVVLEDKGRAIGVHTRRATHPDEAFVALMEPVSSIAGAHGLTIEPGRHVIEVRSSTITKGDAMTSLVDQLGPRVVVMMGDDLGDLPAFSVVASLADRGITGIRVVASSREQPAVTEQADVVCDGTDGIASWLEAVVQAVGPTGVHAVGQD